MPDLASLLADLETYSIRITEQSLVSLGVLVLAACLLGLAMLATRGQRRVSLRSVPGYEHLTQAVLLSAESGKAIHLAPGTGTVGETSTADTLAGLTAVEALTGRAAASYVPVVLSTPSPTTLPLLQAAAERAYHRAAASQEYDPSQVRFAGDNRSAYAATVVETLEHENVGTNALIGYLGDEYLLIGEAGSKTGAVQVVGTASTRALPFAVTTADHVILGEELYAAGAYLTARREHLASLLAQDWLRLLLVAAIIGGVIVKTIGS